MQGINQMAETLQSVRNPQNDPRMQQVQEYIRNNGGNAMNACMKYAQEHGMNQGAVQQAYQMACQLFGKK